MFETLSAAVPLATGLMLGGDFRHLSFSFYLFVNISYLGLRSLASLPFSSRFLDLISISLCTFNFFFFYMGLVQTIGTSSRSGVCDVGYFRILLVDFIVKLALHLSFQNIWVLIPGLIRISAHISTEPGKSHFTLLLLRFIEIL